MFSSKDHATVTKLILGFPSDRIVGGLGNGQRGLGIEHPRFTSRDLVPLYPASLAFKRAALAPDARRCRTTQAGRLHRTVQDGESVPKAIAVPR